MEAIKQPCTPKEKYMYKLFYTTNMKPVETGDVVHFSQRAWTVEEVVETPRFLETKVWVRSMDEQHLLINAWHGDFGARWILTK
jgi:hypothetical protein